MFYCSTCGARSERAYPNRLHNHPPEQAYLCHACHLLSLETPTSENLFHQLGALDPNAYAQIRRAYPPSEDVEANFDWMKLQINVINEWLMAHGHVPMKEMFASYLEGHLYVAYTRALAEYETVLRDIVTSWRKRLTGGVFDSSNMDRLIVRICRRVGIR